MPKSDTTADSAWLIEHGDSEVSGPEYLMIEGNHSNPQIIGGNFAWTTEHMHAIRFSRRQDAVLFVCAMRQLSKHIPHGKTLEGLNSHGIGPRVCEHSWDMKIVREKDNG